MAGVDVHSEDTCFGLDLDIISITLFLGEVIFFPYMMNEKLDVHIF